MTHPHKSLSLFIAHQPTDLRDRSNPESLCSAQMEELLGRGASVLHCNLHSLTTSMFRPDVEVVLHDDSIIGSTAEWDERTRHEKTSGNENQPGPATEIEYIGRRSPLCGVVLRDHSREHLIRCQASLRMHRWRHGTCTKTDAKFSFRYSAKCRHSWVSTLFQVGNPYPADGVSIFI